MVVNAKVTAEMFKELAKIVDATHSTGKVIVSKMVISHFIDNFGVLIHQTTVGRMMNRLGLKWGTIKPEVRTYAAYRLRSVRDYLLALDRYIKQMQKGDSDLVFIFTDESNVNLNHAYKYAYQSNEANIGKLKRKSA